ncbi:hypothetical protein D3C80_1953270 [compost metagenome]
MPVTQGPNQAVDLPMRGNADPRIQCMRMLAEQVLAQVFADHRLPAGQQFALQSHERVGATVANPARGDFGDHGRGHPAVDPQDALGAQRQTLGHHQITDA